MALEPPLDPHRLDERSLAGPVAVIGDIHGRADLLRALVARLDALHPERRMPLVVVGDVCDRGPDTRGVIDLLCARGAVGVRGNHEEWLCRFAAGDGFDPAVLSRFFGGRQTLDAYGIDATTAAGIEAQHDRIPLAHRVWLAALPVALRLMVDDRPFWVVHAGVGADLAASIDPVGRMRAIAHDDPVELLWVARRPDEMDVLDGPIIYGHTPRRAPVDAGHAIGIDTGAGVWPDGALTAVLLPTRRFVTVGHPDGGPPGAAQNA